MQIPGPCTRGPDSEYLKMSINQHFSRMMRFVHETCIVVRTTARKFLSSFSAPKEMSGLHVCGAQMQDRHADLSANRIVAAVSMYFSATFVCKVHCRSPVWRLESLVLWVIYLWQERVHPHGTWMGKFWIPYKSGLGCTCGFGMFVVCDPMYTFLTLSEKVLDHYWTKMNPLHLV